MADTGSPGKLCGSGKGELPLHLTAVHYIKSYPTHAGWIYIFETPVIFYKPLWW